ncbi:MAG: hypothetical protein LUH05_06075 [Candidatus Gastranaerophilales bacterium]|nr:hypothetical protein [Candidatus Gastranaerophilales bacterium]
MKITYPHMGNQIFYKKLVEAFGHEAIEPPTPTQRTIDLGVKYSPEFACFPYKILMGTYIEGLENGADTIVTSGGSGPCRAGLYYEIHKKTLENLGYNPEIIVFDDFGRSPQTFIDNFKKIKGKTSWCKAFRIIHQTYILAQSADNIQKRMEILRAYEVEKGSFNKAFNEIMEDFDKNGTSISRIKECEKRGMEKLNNIKVEMPAKKDRIKVGIVGEIYVVMENSVNMNIAEVLNLLGCEVSRSLYISDWIDHSVTPKIFKKKSGQYLLDNCKQYLDIQIGGHECHNMGNIIDYKQQGYDGIVHLMPFACLPELVTQTLIPRISADYDIPILSLSLDEQTGIANNQTRIEAFVDLLKKNKGE